ncbi:P-loop containing nucleoside triphosphate hydrolase protein [Lentinula aciculospora]|uniref:P-loop containing nucleoside triphosphate hydrolase protein n=1 Tax=Lentinula aciculospora TaxID=153920 RepID=A0A9W9DQ24_9AGAR|nr:P-loop containing nucleoside triphosphate hydrolase protein [Lentinula aciculospora]
MASQEKDESTAALDKSIARYDQYFDLRTFSTTLRKTTKVAPKNRKKHVLLVRRIIDSKGRHVSTDIDVKSPALAEVLREINKGVAGLTLNRNPPLANPKLFFHSRVGIQDKLAAERLKDVPDEGLIADLETAMQYIAEDHSQNLIEYNLLTSQQEITYDLLWALMPPNSLVYHFHQFTEQPQILLAKEVHYYQPSDRPYYVEIVCDIISNDGNFFGLAQVPLEIEIFTGARVIQDLPVFPLSFHKDASELRQHALVRGKKYVSMDQYTYHEISGPVIQERITQQEEVKWYKINSYGRVMIDPVSFRRFEPNRNFNFSVYRRLNRTAISDEQFIICNPVVYGFCFGIKKWGGFAMDRLQDIEWSDDLFNFLVLGQKQKMLISALVRQHVTDDNRFDDIVQGKGKGLVGLLSGRPGCGKTLTAEAIAEKTHRALYVVSAGELGTHPKEVDERLTLILQLAQTWRAVLLLDEAEVFLQRRDFTDLARNALVSIFLRQLEYYQGVLILTTNLLNHIDPAFESRIHFSIQYPDLDFNARRLIWNTFFSKVMDSVDSISPGDLDRLAGYQLNGRQIKNMVGSAQAIALDSNTPLAVEHVDTVLDVVNSWNSEGIPSSEGGGMLNIGVSQSKLEDGHIEEDLLF